MADGNQPKAMDPSWFVCRHVFISTKPEVKQAVDGGAGCSFLSSACQDDLKTGLTKGWGQQDDAFLCGALPLDSIPHSCVDSFGYARQDVMGLCSFPLPPTFAQKFDRRASLSDHHWQALTAHFLQTPR